MKTLNKWIENGTKVIVSLKSGRVITGTIVDGDYNCFTFEKQYDVNYYDEQKGKELTMICVPERAIAVL